MLRISVIGCGAHSRKQHLPALREFAALRSGEIELTAVCDLRADAAERARAQFGFLSAYARIDDMLGAERLDGCVAVTPISVTVEIGRRVVEAGLPLLMEKPPGAMLAEADAFQRFVEERGAPVMVSMNRRFDPALLEALRWKGDRPVDFVRAAMLRSRRTEEELIYTTGIHCVDALRWIAGDVERFAARTRRVGGAAWHFVHLEFRSGAIGSLEILPTSGCVEETYEIAGPEYRIHCRVGHVAPPEISVFEQGRRIRSESLLDGAPECERNGALGELSEFVASIQEGRPPRPGPADTRQSVEICHELLGQAGRSDIRQAKATRDE